MLEVIPLVWFVWGRRMQSFAALNTQLPSRGLPHSHEENSAAFSIGKRKGKAPRAGRRIRAKCLGTKLSRKENFATFQTNVGLLKSLTSCWRWIKKEKGFNVFATAFYEHNKKRHLFHFQARVVWPSTTPQALHPNQVLIKFWRFNYHAGLPNNFNFMKSVTSRLHPNTGHNLPQLSVPVSQRILDKDGFFFGEHSHISSFSYHKWNKKLRFIKIKT